MKINQFVPDTKIFDNLNLVMGKTDNSSDTTNSASSFLDILKDKLDEVNAQQVNADQSTENFIKGDDSDVSQVLLDTEEAKMSLELAVQVRNKLVEAYQEINRMQI